MPHVFSPFSLIVITSHQPPCRYFSGKCNSAIFNSILMWVSLKHILYIFQFYPSSFHISFRYRILNRKVKSLIAFLLRGHYFKVFRAFCTNICNGIIFNSRGHWLPVISTSWDSKTWFWPIWACHLVKCLLPPVWRWRIISLGYWHPHAVVIVQMSMKTIILTFLFLCCYVGLTINF